MENVFSKVLISKIKEEEKSKTSSKKEPTIRDERWYRLYFINYYKKGYPTDKNQFGVVDWPFRPFQLPEGMCREDAFRLLSYLTDFIEKESNLEPCSYKCVEV